MNKFSSVIHLVLLTNANLIQNNSLKIEANPKKLRNAEPATEGYYSDMPKSGKELLSRDRLRTEK